MPEGPEQYAPPESEEKISLRHILTYENPKIDEYRPLIDTVVHSAPVITQPRTMLWGEVFFGETYFPEYDRRTFDPGASAEKIRTFLREKLKNGMLVDLGGGSENAFVMRVIARNCDVRTYISVDLGNDGELDPYAGKRPRPIPEGYISPADRAKTIDEYLVTSDMLDFVARMPDNSSNFVANGIDFLWGTSQKYSEALFREVIRATRSEGILFGASSEIWRECEQLKDKSHEFGYRDGTVLEKVGD